MYRRPKMSWVAQVVIRYEDAYQPMSSRELNWLVICGTAVAMMVLSRAMRNIARSSATIISATFLPLGYSVSSSFGDADPFSMSTTAVVRVSDGVDDVDGDMVTDTSRCQERRMRVSLT